ncbi:unnamed protein product [Orchesella dallaii]|uniref:CFA20 domain-containing protein n=1 Tax=Orchesella dallaii TaxID=48710 RepID=A0ABP1QJ60_9HEXA
MRKNVFPSGFLSIFYSLGSKPLQIWDVQAHNDGHVKTVFDNDICSPVWELMSPNVSLSSIICPNNPKLSLGMKLPVLTMIVKNVNKFFTFEVSIKYDKDMTRRFRASNLNAARLNVSTSTYIVPLRLKFGWKTVQLNLKDLCKCVYCTNYQETMKIQVHASYRIRRIYFLDRVYEDEELPAEFMLYLPLKQ